MSGVMALLAALAIPAQPTIDERFAAGEFGYWHEVVTGTEEPAYDVLIGRRLAESVFPDDIARLEGTDGFAIRNRNGKVYLFGAQASGTLWAVYDFFERNTDIIWASLAEGCDRIFTPVPAIPTNATDVLSVPFLGRRCWSVNNGLYYNDPRTEHFVLRNKCDCLCGDSARRTAAGLPREDFACHNLHTYLPWGKYGATHPEYYAEVDGVRTPPGYTANLCFSSMEGADEFAANFIRDRLEGRPVSLIAGIGVEDTSENCRCAECLKPIELGDGRMLRPEDGQAEFFSARFWLWMNRVAGRIAAAHPEVTIPVIAYCSSLQPTAVVPASNVAVNVSLIGHNLRFPLSDARSDSARQLLDGWKALSPQLSVYEYWGCAAQYPRPVEYVLRNDLKTYGNDIVFRSGSEWIHKNGAEYVSAIDFWVSCRLLWDPDQDVDALRAEFCRRAFREAAADMLVFYDAVRNAWFEDVRSRSTWSDSPVAAAKFFLKSDPVRAEAALAALAAAASKPDNAQSRFLIGKIRETMARHVDQARKEIAAETGFVIPSVRCTDPVRADSAVWSKAVELPASAFRPSFGTTGTLSQRLSVQMFADGSRLWVKTSVVGQADLTADVGFYSRDHWDLYLDRPSGNRDFCHLGFDAAGNKVSDCDFGRQPEALSFEVSTAVTADGWEAVASVSLEDLRLPDDRKLRLSICHGACGGTEIAGWNGAFPHNENHLQSVTIGAEPTYGGLYFDRAVEVDGIWHVAGTTVYATSWPTQMSVRPVVPAGGRFLWFRTDTPRATYVNRIQPNAAEAMPTVRLAGMDGAALLTPPYETGEVATNRLSFAEQVWWVDASAAGGDAVGDGSEVSPFETIQQAVDRYATRRVPTLILVRPGVYGKGGATEAGHACRVALPADSDILVRSTEGADVTFIDGAADAETYPSATGAAKGCGPNAVRCVGFGYNAAGDACIQGFTLRNGHSDLQSGKGAWTASDEGGGICAQRSNYGISRHMAADCVISNCHAYMGAAAFNLWLVRCRVMDCANVYGDALYGCRLVSCLTGAGAGTGSFRLHCTSPVSMPGFSYNSIAGAQRLGVPGVYWGSVSEKNGLDGSPVGYTWSTGFLVDPANGDYRIVFDSAAHGRAKLPSADTDDWRAWTDVYAALCTGDADGNRVACRNGVPWSGALMRTVAVQTISIPAGSWPCGVDLAGCSAGENRMKPGQTLTIRPNETGSRYAVGLTVNGAEHDFCEFPDGTFSYTVPATFDDSVVIEIAPVLSTDWYVSPDGSDANKGFTTNRPFRTLKYAMSRCPSGQRILAMPGVYAEGVTDAAGDANPVRPYCRVNLKHNVTLESLQGPEKTVIMGAPATGEDADEYGRGEGAVACVRYQSVAAAGRAVRLRGFTLTGGCSELVEGTNLDRLSGAAVNALWSNTDPCYASIENCIITNNFGKAQVLSAGMRVCNSVIGGNLGGNAFKNFLQGCVIRDGTCASMYGMENCTVGKDAAFSLEKYHCVNSLVMGKVNWHGNGMTFTNCVFLTGREAYKRVDCIVTNAAGIAVDENYVPTNKASAVVDYAGDKYAVDGRISEMPDARGGQRVYNGALDVGAVEYDWRGDYAKDISRNGLFAVSNATPEVVESDAQTLLVPAGASVKGYWATATVPKRAVVKVRIEGTGTFKVKVGGATVATLAGPAATPTDVGFSAEAGKPVEFAYDGADGHAEILDGGLSSGLMVLVQ